MHAYIHNITRDEVRNKKKKMKWKVLSIDSFVVRFTHNNIYI
jgi:hypothetical protein